MNTNRIKDKIKGRFMKDATVKFYTTDWNPNGTSTLIVVDSDHQIVEYLEECLFGPPLDSSYLGEMFGAVHMDIDGESVASVEEYDADQLESNTGIVYPLDIESVLDCLAESPVHSRFSQIKRVLKAVNKA